MAFQTMPTLTMIEALLKSFCERTGTKLPPPLPKEIAEKKIDLGWAASPLPCSWLQYLDLKTGDFYWINSNTGKRTAKDPRRIAGRPTYYSEEISDVGSDSNGFDEDRGVDNSSGITYDPPRTPPESSKPANFLVVSACKACLKYIMVAEGTTMCPKCGGALLHFGQDRCF